MSVPLIYAKMHAIMQGIKGVSKSQHAPMGYDFRGIDDAYDAAQPQFVEHGVICMPETLKITRETIPSAEDRKLRIWTIVEVAYNFYCVEDGSSVRAVVAGEGMDYGGDKATPCAMSTAYKTMMWQTFCIRVQGQSYDTETRNDAPSLPAGRTSVARPPPPRTPTPQRAPAPAAAIPQGGSHVCPKCGGEMWDNSAERKQDQQDIANGTRTKKARPAYSCKDKDCGGIIWSSSDATKPPPPPPQPAGPAETAINEMDMIADIQDGIDTDAIRASSIKAICASVGIPDHTKWAEGTYEQIKALHARTVGIM